MRWPRDADEWTLVLSCAIALGGVYTFFRFDRSDRELGIALKQHELELSKQFDETDRKLDASLKQHEEESTRFRITPPSHRLVLTPQGADVESPTAFIASYRVTVPNNSPKKIQLTYASIEAFLAELPSLNADGILVVNEAGDNGSVKWKLVHSQGHYYYDGKKWQDGKSFKPTGGGARIAYSKGGGTADLDPGEVAECATNLIISGKPQLLAFRTRLGVNADTEQEDRWVLSDVWPVGKHDAASTVESTKLTDAVK